MKRIAGIVCFSLMMVLAATSMCFGAEFKIEKTTPEDGATGAAVDNMGVKVYFSEEVYSKENAEANSKLCHLTDEKGNDIPAKVVFSKEDKNVMLVLADTEKKTNIKGKTKYTMTIDEGFISASGDTLEEEQKVSFTTMNPRTSMKVSMAMMGIMMVAMIVVTMREAKKKAYGEQTTGKRGEKKPEDPYKVAKKTGKSVEEVVAAQEKKKAKKKAAKEKKEQQIKERADKREEKRHKKQEDELERLRKYAYKVSKPRPISEAGSTYRAKINEED